MPKVSKDPMVVKILALRDKLIKEGHDAEKVGMACKGMYKCSKLADASCLDKIHKALEAMKGKKGGRKSRSRSRSRGRTKRRSRSRSRSRSRGRK